MKTLQLAIASLLLAAAASGQNLSFTGSDFASWAHPQGLVEVLPQGIKVKRFEQRFNAVANAREFSGMSIGEYGQRFARTPSNQQQADLAGDQDPIPGGSPIQIPQCNRGGWNWTWGAPS